MPDRVTATAEDGPQLEGTQPPWDPDTPPGGYEPIAVIGVGLRFPGGNDTLPGFTEFLRSGRSGIRPLPRDRWDVDAHTSDDPDAPAAIRTAGGGFLDQIDEFDAKFFSIPPKQAPYLDPHQRLLLETAWEALENAGTDPAALRHGDGAVYVGATPMDFMLGLASLPVEALDGRVSTGMGGFSLSGRLSYFLGWRGPSLTVDTACASSLTALHLAVRGLQNGETSIALCGAVNALHDLRTFAILSRGNMLAGDGHCKAFDEAADGYGRAEGCGVLALKRLSDARRDSDTILALIRGTAIGQDGESAGMTAPNGMAQEGVMRAALTHARLSPGDIQYIEAHGTGTPLGDPIEMGSINGVFGASHDTGNPVTVGSLKSNLGHMEAAAGIGAVIKVISQLRAGQHFPHLLQNPSGRIPWDSYPITVPRECRTWQAPVRRAMVNGFGVGGHIGIAVLEEAPAAAPRAAADDDSGHLFTLSAKSDAALKLQVERYQGYLAEHPEIPLAEVCYTRNVGRAHFRYRMAGVVRDRGQLAELLDEQAAVPGTTRSEVYRRVALLFTGSGSQYVGMGSDLYERFPVFRAQVDECDQLLRPYLGRSVADIMFGRVPDAEEALAGTLHTHAALFTLEYALAQLWLSWGIRPNVLIGHSVGEVVAATVSGLFSLPDGVAFLATRARLIGSVTTPGGMAAAAASAADLAPLIEPWPDLAIAAINAPQQCVLSGGSASLGAATELLRERGIDVRPLGVSTAFHSPLMAGISDDLRAFLDGVDFHEPTMTIVSNLTGDVVPPREMATADYWIRHLTEAVDFAAGIQAVGNRGKHVFVEVGPSATLTMLARQCLPDGPHRWLTCLHPKEPAGATISRALAGMYTAGLNPSWVDVYAGRPVSKVALPSYAFDRRRYWLPAPAADPGGAEHRLLGREVTGPAPDTRVFSTRISVGRPDYLGGYVLGGEAVLPAAAYLETLLALADAVFGDTTRPIEEVRFHEALFLTGRAVELRTRATPGADGRLAVEIVSPVPGPGPRIERLHATAIVGAAGDRSTAPTGSGQELAGRIAEVGEPDQITDGTDLYTLYARTGLVYGPPFARVRSVARYGGDFAVSELDGRDLAAGEYLPPPVLDSATHALAALLGDDHGYVVTRVARLRMFKKPRAARLRAALRTVPEDDGAGYSTDVLLLEGDEPVMELSGMVFRRLARRTGTGTGTAATPGTEGRTRPGVDPATLATMTPVERSVAVRDLVCGAIADLVAFDEVSAVESDATFVELGIDSLLAIKLTSVLEERSGLQLRASEVFDHSSVTGLVRLVDRRLPGPARSSDG